MYSSVIYLRPDAGRRDRGVYEQIITGHRVFIEYQVLRLIEMEGEPILDTKPTGLLPFTPLMKRPTDMDAEEWLRRCVQTADSVDVPNKPAYLGSLAVLGNLVYESELISDIILEETMQQPNIIEYWTEKATAEAHQQGLEQGMKERAREDILEALELRLQPEVARAFKSVLATIENSQRLKQLLRAAILAESPEDFRRALASSGE